MLAARGDELWLAYEHAQMERYLTGRTDHRRLLVAKVEPQGLMTPKDYQASPLWGRCEAARLAFDESGRLAVAYLRPRLPRAGWDTYLTSFDGTRWTTPQPLSATKGLDRRPGLARVGQRWTVAFQADTMPVSWSDVDQTAKATSNILLATVDPGPLPAASTGTWEPLTEPDEPFEVQSHKIPAGPPKVPGRPKKDLPDVPPPVPEEENFALAPGVPKLLGYGAKVTDGRGRPVDENAETLSLDYGRGRRDWRSPWSIATMQHLPVRRQCPPLRSALLVIMSKAASC